MLAKTLSIVLAISLLHVLTAKGVLAQANLADRPGPPEKGVTVDDSYGLIARNTTSKEAKFAAKVKLAIAKLGTGAEARMEVTLRDKTKLKGYVSEISDEHFAIVDDKTGTATQVTYPQVKKVKGNNLSTGAKIAIAIGVIIAISVLFAISIGDDFKKMP
jgi:hypothetical protein